MGRQARFTAWDLEHDIALAMIQLTIDQAVASGVPAECVKSAVLSDICTQDGRRQ